MTTWNLENLLERLQKLSKHKRRLCSLLHPTLFLKINQQRKLMTYHHWWVITT